MKDLRIVFMGTPEFAVCSLEALLNANLNVVGVVTTPDKPSGRGRKLRGSAVKEFALKNDLPLLQPEKLRDPDFINALKAWEPDLMVVVAFRMLPEVVWKLPQYGTFNLHGSLLPKYRGAAPIHWAVINGEAETGVTTFFIDQKIDTGDIIDAVKTSIGPEETTGDVHDRLMHLGAQLVVKTVTSIANGTASSQQQSKDAQMSPAPKLNQSNTQIDWSLPLEAIYNKVRGLNPFPGAWTTLIMNEEEQVVKIYKVQIERYTHEYKTGTLLVTKSDLKVATPEGLVNVLEIKIPGKRTMPVKDLLNGFSFEKNARFA